MVAVSDEQQKGQGSEGARRGAMASAGGWTVVRTSRRPAEWRRARGQSKMGESKALGVPRSRRELSSQTPKALEGPPLQRLRPAKDQGQGLERVAAQENAEATMPRAASGACFRRTAANWLHCSSASVLSPPLQPPYGDSQTDSVFQVTSEAAEPPPRGT